MHLRKWNPAHTALVGLILAVAYICQLVPHGHPASTPESERPEASSLVNVLAAAGFGFDSNRTSSTGRPGPRHDHHHVHAFGDTDHHAHHAGGEGDHAGASEHHHSFGQHIDWQLARPQATPQVDESDALGIVPEDSFVSISETRMRITPATPRPPTDRGSNPPPAPRGPPLSA